MTDHINHRDPVDQLFRQALTDYAPTPPSGAWKKINARLGKGGNWYMNLLRNPYGLSVLSAVFIGITAWLIFMPSDSPEDNTASKLAPKTTLVDSSRSDSSDSHIPSETNKPQLSTETKTGAEKTNSASGNLSQVSEASNPVKHSITAVDRQETVWQSVKVESGSAYDKKTVPQSFPVTVFTEENKTVDDNGKNPSGPVNDSSGMVPVAPVEQFRDTTKKINFDNPPTSNNPADPEGIPANGSASPEPPDGSGTPESMNQNKKLFFNIGLNGNYGKVLQKGRSAKDWYGTELTTGVWLPGITGGLSTGIGLQKFKDEGSFVFEYQTVDTTGIRMDTTWYFQDSIPYFEVSNTILTDTSFHSQELTSGFSYTYIKIPLYFTKQLYTAGNFVLGLKVGPSVSILISKSEEVPSFTPPSGTLTSSSNNSYQRLKTSWQLLLAPQLSYQFGSNLRIYAEPSFTWFINNLYDKKKRPVANPYGFSIFGCIEFSVR